MTTNGWLTRTEIHSHNSGDKSEFTLLAGLVGSIWGAQEGSVPRLCLSFWWLLAVLSALGLVGASLQASPFSHGILLCVFRCSCGLLRYNQSLD